MAECLSDLTQEFDVGLLDQVVVTFYSSTGDARRTAEEILTRLQEDEEAWNRVDTILEKSTVPETKFIALQIMDKFIRTRWNTLQPGVKDATRNFIVDVIVKVSSDEITFKKEHIFVGKLNMVLVQILKQDWPHNWPCFILEIVSSSHANLTLCENNMAILKVLSEEIFDYSADQMTQLKTSNLRQLMCNEFSEIFKLCKEILEKATKPSLIKATLDTLLRFLTWIPIGYIFETNLLDILKNIFESPMYRNSTLKCLIEIGSLSAVSNNYSQKIIILFAQVISTVYTVIPPHIEISTIYEESSDDDQEFVQNLALFLTSFLSSHLRNLEQSSDKQALQALLNAHFYLLRITQVQDREIFKICLEYWAKLVRKLFEESLVPLHCQSRSRNQDNFSKKCITYDNVLSRLRVIMIETMAKPEEVLIVENEEGELVREFVKESDTIVLYKSMKEVLVFLTNLDVIDTANIMKKKLKNQTSGTKWSRQDMNRLCWAIGSISGAMPEDFEKSFLMDVIKYLLDLCETNRDKNNKAAIASNIMYIVGQYPRFLKTHWKFLRIVINKLIEFMHEAHDGVQDMACDTFLKISRECKRCFVTTSVGEVRPLVVEIIEKISQTTSELSPQQIYTFYEAVAYMVLAEIDKTRQEQLIHMLLQIPNGSWYQIMGDCKNGIDVLNNAGQVKVLSHVLKTNVSVCVAIGPGFVSQLGKIYSDLLALYRAAGVIVSDLEIDQGFVAVRTTKVRALRSIKKDVLKLIYAFIENATDLAYVAEFMVNPFLYSVLSDYKNTMDIARDAEVLTSLAMMITKLGPLMKPCISLVFEATFEPTLNMITANFIDFPEIRSGFYKLLRAVNAKCFPALLELSPERFKLFIDSIIWGFKHTMRDIADISLYTCEELLLNVRQTDDINAGAFFRSYYLTILQDVLSVLTDCDHKSGFKGQTEVLAQLFQLVANDCIKITLFDTSQTTDPYMSNAQFLNQYVSALLQNAFPHLKSKQIKSFVKAMMEYNIVLPKFKLEVRDFLNQLKEFTGENAELYLEEKKAEMNEKKRQEKEKVLLVPGVIKPSDLTVKEVDVSIK
ncbi:nuclear export factor CRM1 [Parasitella parasitica]|nr:nuclear export factor CRM1 [Parasitella parasitica]